MRVEWCRAQARAERLQEEVELLVCEMRRVLAFFRWRVRQWERRVCSRAGRELSLNRNVAAGISAYAHRQAELYRQLSNACVHDWYESLELKSLASTWLLEYSCPSTSRRCRRRRRLISNVRLYHSTDVSSSDDEDCPTQLDLPRTQDSESESDSELEAGILEDFFEWTADD